MESGRLPLVFLHGCGLSDSLIESIYGSSQFYTCFISYSHKDREFVKRLVADLEDNGVRCWCAEKHIQAGKKLHHQIDEAIQPYDKLLLILSEHSMISPWVETEIREARKRERKEGRQMFFPISVTSYESIKNWVLFNSDEGRDLAREIREYSIPDFSNWKNHDDYHTAFNGLLRDLKAEKELKETEDERIGLR